MVVVMALGGSTNAVLHLIAMARSVGVPLTLDDFQTVSDRVPFLADLKPSGRYVQEDLHHVGGTPAVMRYLLSEGLLTGDCLTVSGKTLAENLADVEDYPADQQIIEFTHIRAKAAHTVDMATGADTASVQHRHPVWRVEGFIKNCLDAAISHQHRRLSKWFATFG